LSDNEHAARIQEASLQLLDRPGIRLEHEGIVQRLLAAGAKAGDGADVVRLPREMVEEAVQACPREVRLADRQGNAKTLTATSDPCIWSSPGMTLMRDGEARPFTSSDMVMTSRLLQQLDQVDVIVGMAMDDVPPSACDVVGLQVMAANSTKHIRAVCYSPGGAEVMTRMKPVVGDYPWFGVGFTAHGPLRWTNLALTIYERTAGHGIPATVNGEPMAGTSGPVTLAGTAAVGNAEILAGIVVNQMLEPGRPLIYNLGLAHVFDMRTAIAVTGGPENALLAKISAMMGRFYDLPSSSWVSTESMCPDSQAALEKMFGWHTHMTEGVSAIWGVGQLESEITFSPAQAVIDNEMIAFARRYARGFDTNDASLALDVCREVGIAGSFLEHIHTLRGYRNELFQPNLLFRENRDRWNELGRPALHDRAEAIASDLMANEVDPGLDDDQLRTLRKMADTFVAEVRW